MDYKTKRAVKAMQEVEDEAFADLVDQATDKVVEMEERPKDEVVHIEELSDELAEVRQGKGKMRGISTGLTQLDAKMGGLEPGTVVLIGGETSQGKSALATNIAASVATKHPVLYVSLEMSLNQMLERLDAVTENPLRLNILFQRSFALNYKDIEPLLKKAKQSRDIKLVVLDYLQYLGRGMTLEEVAKMSKEVKSIANRYQVCFVVIVSLRKAGGQEKYKRKWTDIGIDDLMGTAAIGYDCDQALVTSRKDTDNQWQADKLYVRILKNRTGHYDYNDSIIELEWDKTKVTEAWKAVVK